VKNLKNVLLPFVSENTVVDKETSKPKRKWDLITQALKTKINTSEEFQV
jgi:hypothetical protein